MTQNPEDCERCRRFLAALRETHKRLAQAEREGTALQEELLAAGEIIDNLAKELEKHQYEDQA
jgi:hypothetical protein